MIAVLSEKKITTHFHALLKNDWTIQNWSGDIVDNPSSHTKCAVDYSFYGNLTQLSNFALTPPVRAV